jgi:general secretion pathway protein N
MRWPTVVILGAVSYLFFLIASLPAQQLVGWFGGGGPAQALAIEGVSGTIWSGEAQRVSFKHKSLGELTWSFKPLRLFLGKLAYSIELKDTGQQLQGIFSTRFSDTFSLENVDALLQAGQVAELLQQRQIRIEGKVRAQELDLVFSKGQLTAAYGNIQWLGAALQSPMNMAIGDLQADFSTDDASGDIKGLIRDIKGPIAVQAEVHLKTDGNFQFTGKLKPGDKADPGLAGALRAIGQQQPDGSIQLKYAGRI